MIRKRTGRRGVAVAVGGLTAAGLLAGCGAARPVGVVDLGATHLVLQRTGGTPALSLRDGEAASAPLPDLTDARITQAWSVRDATLVLIEGSTAACPHASVLALARDGAVSVRRIGACNDQFAFGGDGRAVVLRTLHSRRPTIWRYAGGVLDGPLIMTAGPGRGRRAGAARGAGTPVEPAAETLQADLPKDRTSADAARQGTGEGAGSSAAGAADEMAGMPPLPSISRPVGDDVVPRPLGAGPLPAGASPPPAAFGAR